MKQKTSSNTTNEKDLCRLYYIYGEEEYLKIHYCSDIINKAVSAVKEMNVTEFDGKNFELIDLENCINSYPVMSDKKAVKITDMDNNRLKKEFSSELLKILENIPDFCVVVFYDTQCKNSSNNAALIKLIEKAGGITEKADHPSYAKLETWCYRHFKNEGKNISRQDLAYFLQIADNDMTFLNNEILKLCSSTDAETITKADMDSIVVKSVDANRYEIIDAFCSGKYSEVVKIIDKLYLQNTDDMMIANVFYKAFLDLWHARLALDGMKTQSQLAQDFGMRTYGANKAMKNVRGMSLEFIHQSLQLALKLDTQLKSTPYNKRDLITAFAADIIYRRDNVKA